MNSTSLSTNLFQAKICQVKFEKEQSSTHNYDRCESPFFKQRKRNLNTPNYDIDLTEIYDTSVEFVEFKSTHLNKSSPKWRFPVKREEKLPHTHADQITNYRIINKSMLDINPKTGYDAPSNSVCSNLNIASQKKYSIVKIDDSLPNESLPNQFRQSIPNLYHKNVFIQSSVNEVKPERSTAVKETYEKIKNPRANVNVRQQNQRHPSLSNSLYSAYQSNRIKTSELGLSIPPIKQSDTERRPPSNIYFEYVSFVSNPITLQKNTNDVKGNNTINRVNNSYQNNLMYRNKSDSKNNSHFLPTNGSSYNDQRMSYFHGRSDKNDSTSYNFNNFGGSNGGNLNNGNDLMQSNKSGGLPDINNNETDRKKKNKPKNKNKNKKSDLFGNSPSFTDSIENMNGQRSNSEFFANRPGGANKGRRKLRDVSFDPNDPNAYVYDEDDEYNQYDQDQYNNEDGNNDEDSDQNKNSENETVFKFDVKLLERKPTNPIQSKLNIYDRLNKNKGKMGSSIDKSFLLNYLNNEEEFLDDSNNEFEEVNLFNILNDDPTSSAKDYKALLKTYSKLFNFKFLDGEGGPGEGNFDEETFSLEDDWLLKWCILKNHMSKACQIAFSKYDVNNKGFLKGEDLLRAIHAISKLNNLKLGYLFNVLDLCNVNALKNGADLTLFTLIIALANRINHLDEAWFSNLLPQYDLFTVENKVFKVKHLWNYLVDPSTKTININDLLIEFQAGGVTSEHVRYAKDKFSSKRHFELTDYLTYIPLFVYIHDKIINNPLNSKKDL